MCKNYLAILIVLMVTMSSYSQKKMAPPEFDLQLSPTSFEGSDTLMFTLQVKLDKGWHVNSYKPLNEFAIPTRVEVVGTGINYGEIEFPPAEKKYIKSLNSELLLYEGTFKIKGKLWKSGADADLSTLKLQFYYQACSDEMCLRPTSREVSPSPSSGGIKKLQDFSKKEKLNSKSDLKETVNRTTSSVEKKSKYDNNLLMVIIMLIIGGLALNLTPCVYPLIAITISLFGGQGKRSLQGRIIMSMLYVLGMMLSFSVLGLLAALSGSLFGSVLQSSGAQIVIAVIFVALALSSFGLFELGLPSGLMGKAMNASNVGGYAGGLFAGLFAGILASPCIGPFVLSLLIYVAERKEVFTGFWMFATLALGMGLPYLVLGIFTSLTQNLPKSGGWMIDVKKILGVVLLGLACYYLRAFMSEEVYHMIFGGLIIYASLYVNPFQAMNGVSHWLGTLLRTLALLGLIVGATYFIKGLGVNTGSLVSVSETSSASHVSAGIEWQDYSEVLVEEAKSKGKRILIDFESKIWCAACREMEEKTYPKASVIKALSDYVTLRVDVDKHPNRDALMKQFQILGVPTVIILSPAGEVIKTIPGFLPPQEFIEALPKVVGTI